MFELYSYYQVSDAQASALLPLVRAMQAALAAAHGVGTSLKCRHDSRQGLQTWMEIYTGAGPAFGDALALAGNGVAHLLAGPRHTEVFTEMPPCA
jgi:hypothetical protein